MPMQELGEREKIISDFSNNEWRKQLLALLKGQIWQVVSIFDIRYIQTIVKAIVSLYLLIKSVISLQLGKGNSSCCKCLTLCEMH